MLALLVGLYVSVNPSSISNIANYNVEKVYADVTLSTDGSGSGDSDTTPSLKLTLGENIQSQETMQANEVGYISNDFTIEANNINKYYITVQAASGYDSNLVGLASKETIRGVGSNKTPANFASNTWGYNLTEVGSSNTSGESGSDSSTSSNTNIDTTTLTYNTVPESTNATPMAYDTNTTGLLSIDYKLTFAAKLGEDKPSDHYQSQVLLSVASEPGEVAKLFSGISTMQEMTNSICANAQEGDTKQLVDDRLGQKTYWVTRFKDGGCWMTQNLDLDLMAGVYLTPEDSDIESLWNPNTGTHKDNVASWNASNSSLVQVYDPGDMIATMRGPSSSQCQVSGNITSLSQCASYGYKDVTGWAQSSQAALTTVYNESTKTYDAHYHVGNYYNWTAATAGSGISITDSGTAPNSICPRGWKLPLYGQPSVTGSFVNLLSHYGYANGAVVDTKFYSNPFYFVVSGDVDGNYMGYVGYYGFYRTNGSVGRYSESYALQFGGSNVNKVWTDYSGMNYTKVYGQPIRCVFIP